LRLQSDFQNLPRQSINKEETEPIFENVSLLELKPTSFLDELQQLQVRIMMSAQLRLGEAAAKSAAIQRLHGQMQDLERSMGQ
jgi:hypothetical protein